MNKPISTKVHGILDFATAGFALAFSHLLPCRAATRHLVTSIALGKIVYALFTRHELGVVKKLPMKAHLVMDTVGGAGLCALPFVTGEDDPATIGCCVGLGIFDIVAAPLSQTQAPSEPLPHRPLPEAATRMSDLPQSQPSA